MFSVHFKYSNIVYITFLLLLNVLIFCEASPNGESLENLLKTIKYSSDIVEDAFLDAPELISKYGYPQEEHEVITEDGYILTLHRIPHGKNAKNDSLKQRIPVLLQHGLFCSSTSWINLGPGSSLAYILADEGYDVWLGNSRGTYYSRKHKSLNPNGPFKHKYWNFSWEEMGLYDLPAIIDHILSICGAEKLQYVGHSQGTTSYLVLNSLRPEYNEKIISGQLLAPVAFTENVRSIFLRFIAKFSNNIKVLSSLIGANEFLPHSSLYSKFATKYCKDKDITQFLCENIIFLIAGFNERQLNTTTIPLIYGHVPAGSSVKQLAHFGQNIAKGTFTRYDYGLFGNMKRYATTRPPEFPLVNVSAPAFLHYSEADYISDSRDVDRLFRELPAAIGKFRVQLPEFTHMDFLFGIDAKRLVWDRVLTYIKATDKANC